MIHDNLQIQRKQLKSTNSAWLLKRRIYRLKLVPVFRERVYSESLSDLWDSLMLDGSLAVYLLKKPSVKAFARREMEVLLGVDSVDDWMPDWIVNVFIQSNQEGGCKFVEEALYDFLHTNTSHFIRVILVFIASRVNEKTFDKSVDWMRL